MINEIVKRKRKFEILILIEERDKKLESFNSRFLNYFISFSKEVLLIYYNFFKKILFIK